jgi:hypothetical protein
MTERDARNVARAVTMETMLTTRAVRFDGDDGWAVAVTLNGQPDPLIVHGHGSYGYQFEWKGDEVIVDSFPGLRRELFRVRHACLHSDEPTHGGTPGP